MTEACQLLLVFSWLSRANLLEWRRPCFLLVVNSSRVKTNRVVQDGFIATIRSVDCSGGGWWHSFMRRPSELSASPTAAAHAAAPSPSGDWLTAQKRDPKVAACWKLCDAGPLTQAADALALLVHQGYHIPYTLFYRALRRCTAPHKNLLPVGQRIHSLTVRSGYEGHAFLTTHLIGLYAAHGRLEDAWAVFSKVAAPDRYNWSAILFAYARHGEPEQALELYRRMRQTCATPPGNRVFVAVLKACASAKDLDSGKAVHAHILLAAAAAATRTRCAGEKQPDDDVFVQTGLIDMYGKCGCVEDARAVFDRLRRKDLVSWTAMIAVYAQQGMYEQALDLYRAMQQEEGGHTMAPPNPVTYLCLLQACASVGARGLHQGRQLHAQIAQRGLHHDPIVGSSLVNMYAKCGSLADAQQVFDALPCKTVVTWTAMIAGYSQQGQGQAALRLYSSMQHHHGGVTTPPDAATFVCLLQACASVGHAALRQGQLLHRQVEAQGLLQGNVVVGASLVHMYAKCSSDGAAAAERVFRGLPRKNAVTWTAMIGCYAHHGRAQDALGLYTQMRQQQDDGGAAAGAPLADPVTYACLLQACAAVAALGVGRELHAEIEHHGMHHDPAVCARLVHMYAKCGSVEDAQQVFDSTPTAARDTVSWSALIAGYARRGDTESVFDLLDKMQRAGVPPNSVTFLSVLTACSHAGLVDKGRHYFAAMRTEHGIAPAVEHYACVVDLLGRAGHVREALRVAQGMAAAAAVQPDGGGGAVVVVWLTLLGACRKWSNVEVAEQAFECAVACDRLGAAAYGLMTNVYAEAAMWEEAQQVQARRLGSGAWKRPGLSWCTDVGGAVHKFSVGAGDNREEQAPGGGGWHDIMVVQHQQLLTQGY